ncbi:MAG: ABC transporter permease, partial [Streptosporangiaceae bacterium]
LAAQPLLSGAAVVSFLPPVMEAWQYRVRGQLQTGGAAALEVSAGFFQLMGARILAGRNFLASDSPASSPVALINASMASRFFPRASPLGRELWIEGYGTAIVIGIVSDTVFRESDRQGVAPMAYLCTCQFPPYILSLVVEGLSTAAATNALVRRTVVAADPEIAAGPPQTLATIWRTETALTRVMGNAGSLVGSVAAALAGFGIFALFLDWARSHQRDTAVRMALGATRGRVLGWLLAEASPIVGAGLLAGGAILSMLPARLPGLAGRTSLWDAIGGLTAMAAVAAAAVLATALLAAASPILSLLRDQ